MDDQTHSLLSSLQRIPHSSEGLQQLLEVAESARIALSADPDGLHDLAQGLVSWSAGSEDGVQAARVLIESARILIELTGDWEYGVDVYERALKRAPTELDALQRVERLLSIREAWERLEVVLLTHANALDYDALFEVALRGEAWRRLGQLRATRLCDLDGAIVAYDTALEVHPEPTWMLELAELYDQRNQADDPTAATQLYYRAADIIDGPAVIPYLEKALDRDPHHEAALDMLEAFTPTEEVGMRLEPRWRAFAADAVAGEKRTSVVQRLANHYAQGVASTKAVEKLSRTLSPPPPSTWASKTWLRFRKPQVAATLPSGSTLRPPYTTSVETPIPQRPAARWYTGPATVCAFAIIVLWSAPQFRVIATAIGAASPSERTPAPPALPAASAIQPHTVSASPAPSDQDTEAPQAASAREVSPKVTSADVSPPRFRVTNGSIPAPQLASVLTEVQRELEHCAAPALASDSKPRGSMVLSWVIKPYGRSMKVRYRRGSIQDKEARLCAQNVVRDTRFPKPAAGTASVEATFELISKGSQGSNIDL